MKREMRIWVLLIMTIPIFGACQKAELNGNNLKCPVTAIEGANDSVIGKWKLIKTRTSGFYQQSGTEDYSCDHIIYHFKDGSSLNISGVQEGMLSFSNGEHTFAFSDTAFIEGMGDKYKFTLKIGYNSAACAINNNTMIVDYSPLDGNTYYFVRVE